MSELVFLNGQLVESQAAQISAFDAGFTHGAGLFETLRIYNRNPFRMDDHLDRMRASAASLELPAIGAAIDNTNIKAAISDLLAANSLSDARLRIVITAGGIPRPGMGQEAVLTPTVLITTGALQPYDPALYRHGMRVCISPYRVNKMDPLAAHKSLSYLPRLMAMRDAHQRSCQESLWFNTENLLSEGSVCNVFVVRAGSLYTPPADTPCLPGITRKVVLSLAGGQKMSVQETPINIDHLLEASEVFLTSSIMEIMPVTAIEKHQVGDGMPGPITKTISKLFAEQVARECIA